MSELDFDVAVAGGSIGGATAAIEIARRGYTVCVVDKAGFPRRKPCGEGLSRRGYAVTERLGITTLLVTHPLFGYDVSLPSGRRFEIGHDTNDLPPMYGIRRTTLDHALAATAGGTPGVRFFPPARVTSARRRSGIWELSLDGSTVRAPYLIIADGNNSTLSRLLEIPEISSPAERYGFSTEWEGDVPNNLNRVRLHVTRGVEYFCTPTTSRTLNISILGRKEGIGLAVRDSDRLTELMAAMGFEGTRTDMGFGAGPVNSRRRMPVIDGALLVGDACETFDPIGGMGMTHALLSGELSGREIAQAFEDGSFENASRSYQREREVRAAELRAFTRIIRLSLTSRLGRAIAPSWPARLAAVRWSSEIHGLVSEKSFVSRALSRLSASFERSLPSG